MDNNRVIEKLKGKRLSILGDSISTFDGYSNNSTYNKTLVSNATYYKHPFNVDDTYWMQLVKKYNLKLCVNNSWSGAYLTKHFPNVGGDYSAVLSPGVERVKYLADNNGESPDIIIVFMGVNDLGVNIDLEIFKDSYLYILNKIKKLYGDAIIICVGLPNILNERKEKTQGYNMAIKETISNFKNALFVDLFLEDEDMYRQNTLDGVHPNAKGMVRIFELVGKNLDNYFSKVSL